MEQFAIQNLSAPLFSIGGHRHRFHQFRPLHDGLGRGRRRPAHGGRQRALVPGRLQSMSELVYEFIANMVRDNVGDAGKKYFPFIFTLFIFILFGNVLGMIPYSFTSTSHIVVTFAMALFVFVGVTIIGLVQARPALLLAVRPAGRALFTALILVPIEIISYLIRPFSLSIRLFANMLVGHTMLKVFGGFVVMLGIFGGGALLAFSWCSPAWSC